MATTYRAAFGNPHAQNSVATSLGIGRPDTSCDAALAKALEEEERDMAAAAAAHPQRAASPSGIRLHVSMEESRADSQRRSTHDGTPAHPVKPAAGQQNGTARLQLSDAELARQLQRVELASAADAAGTTPSMLYPELLGMRSSRELTLDRSLSRAHSVRANPRVVAASVPPSEPVVSADRQRLLTTLRQYDLVEREVQGDGNCQFRALSDQLYGSPEHHAAVRAAVVAVLRQRASSYSCYVPEEYGKYCSSMAKSGTWGDHVTLQAAADHYGLRITVVTSFGESPVIYIDPADKRSPRTLYLSFWAEVHYNSLYPAQDGSGPGW
ncbi:hypothetical protein PLESTB_001155200 [Pleodorina starrii]|uniref:OTU domain-containing protein n=1 Tax=Pleodorina starrii TaxID=330485 RepID=A0A9W6BSC5_9CHLO|nr:hypothetical protein PLESTM_001780700 [Pleodorina starrii]GLC56842.1 hypothetical protein PLESTB_001155200 [Pleodorina starrii]GLC68176.1 hypothetical protein PLESTF_000656900 [Pleodorina starrii]